MHLLYHTMCHTEFNQWLLIVSYWPCSPRALGVVHVKDCHLKLVILTAEMGSCMTSHFFFIVTSILSFEYWLCDFNRHWLSDIQRCTMCQMLTLYFISCPYGIVDWTERYFHGFVYYCIWPKFSWLHCGVRSKVSMFIEFLETDTPFHCKTKNA